MNRHDPLRLVEQAAVSEEVMSALRHDFRNRMTAVRNGAFYVQRKIAGSELATTDPRMVPFLRIIGDETDAACKLLEETSAPERLHKREMAKVDVAACIADAVRWARTLSAETKLSIACPPSQILADRGDITLALRCLVENAAESVGESGAVSIHVVCDRAYARIAVADSGAGLGEHDLAAILQPFFTTKATHAGLGLSITQRIARRYRGDLTMDTVVAGTSFTLTLPLAAEE